MLGPSTFRELEYTALMARVRDIARNASSSWTLATIGSGAFLAWAIAAKDPGVLLPAVMCAACGYYVTLHARRETMLLEGYLRETFECDDAQWHTKLEQAQSLPGVGHANDLLPLVQSQFVALLSIMLAWLFAKHVPHGELLAGLTTSGAVAFGLHSVTEHLRYAQVTSSTYWAHVSGGSRDVQPKAKRVA